MDTIEKILKVYKGKIETQGAQQQDLEKRLDRKCQDQTVLKGRIGTLERELKSLRAEYDGSGCNKKSDFFSSKLGGSASEVGSYLEDEVQRVQLRLSNLEHQCGQTHSELGGRCDALAAVIEGGGYEAVGSTVQLNAVENKVPKASKQDVVSPSSRA